MQIPISTPRMVHPVEATSTAMLAATTASSTTSRSESKSPTHNPTNSSNSNSTEKKWTWSKPLGKPKRPLSSYNLFFRVCREALVSGSTIDHTLSSPDLATNLQLILQDTALKRASEMAAPEAHEAKKKSRSHRRQHGKVSFADMARTVGECWKNLPTELRRMFDEAALVEKAQYHCELVKWKKQQTSDIEASDANNDSDTKKSPKAVKGYSSSTTKTKKILKKKIDSVRNRERRRLAAIKTLSESGHPTAAVVASSDHTGTYTSRPASGKYLPKIVPPMPTMPAMPPVSVSPMPPVMVTVPQGPVLQEDSMIPRRVSDSTTASSATTVVASNTTNNISNGMSHISSPFPGQNQLWRDTFAMMTKKLLRNTCSRRLTMGMTGSELSHSHNQCTGTMPPVRSLEQGPVAQVQPQAQGQPQAHDQPQVQDQPPINTHTEIHEEKVVMMVSAIPPPKPVLQRASTDPLPATEALQTEQQPPPHEPPMQDYEGFLNDLEEDDHQHPNDGPTESRAPRRRMPKRRSSLFSLSDIPLNLSNPTLTVLGCADQLGIDHSLSSKMDFSGTFGDSHSNAVGLDLDHLSCMDEMPMPSVGKNFEGARSA